jgi:hypothetical protein
MTVAECDEVSPLAGREAERVGVMAVRIDHELAVKTVDGERVVAGGIQHDADDRVIGICIVGEQVAGHHRIAAHRRRYHGIDGDREGEVIAREELPVLRDGRRNPRLVCR